MNEKRSQMQDDDIVDEYDEYEDQYGEGGFEKFQKSQNKTPLVKGKKKIKPRQEVDFDTRN